MSEEKLGFFSDPATKAALQNFRSALPDQESIAEDDQFTPHLATILRFMISAAADFDKNCTANIEWIGEQFISSVRLYKKTANSREDLMDIFVMSYRFLCELQFSMPEEELTFDLRKAITYVQENMDLFQDSHKGRLVYATYTMPVQIAKKLIHHPHIAAIRDFNGIQASAPKLKQQWDEEIAAREKKIDALKSELAGLETGFNFVGLVHGFNNLVSQKKLEQRIAFWCLIALGSAITLPLFLELWVIIRHEASVERFKEIILYIVPPALALELVSIYFFRVVLSHFRSIKAQLLQLELRAALCQFIQSYAAYSSEMKKDNNFALEKFESLIFSGLLTNEDKLPTTFDGAEQLAKLFRSAKGA